MISRILHLVNMGLRYGRSKGVRETRLEEPPIGNLAAPCHLEESASHQNPSYCILMTPRHHLNDPVLILWSSIFHDFSWFSPSVPMFGMIPSSSWNKLDTILKYVKNHGDTCREWFIWWRLALDNLDHKGSDLPKWRNPLWPLWRPPVTGRRVLRTISRFWRANLRPAVNRQPLFPRGGLEELANSLS